jgi:5-methylcytosine-specific restriction endonuclease McrA
MPTLSRRCARCRRAVITAGSYCRSCLSAKYKAAGSREQRGLGNAYRKARRAILARDDVCWICGLAGAETTDHVIPRHLGGGSDAANLRPAHFACNASRGARP